MCALRNFEQAYSEVGSIYHSPQKPQTKWINMSSTIKLAEYLFQRLHQLEVGCIYGVPGDYNLTLLDYVEPSGLQWIGTCNELNAGYATDAYSRLKGLGAMITTFGVGELSAINAIAGAYTELAPVVHIVGTPARHVQDARALVHHTFNDGEYGRFAKMHAHVTVAQANLLDPRTAPDQIDAIIQQCLIHSRPVYIQVPVDMVATHVSADNLKTKIELPHPLRSKDEAAALTAVLDRIYACERPMILVDGESRAYGILEQVHKLIETSYWPTFTTIFGKSLVNETWPNVHGVWKGSGATKEDQDFVKSRDLILCFGPHFSTTNSYHSSAIPNSQITILFSSTSVKTCDQTYRDLPAKHFLSALLEKLEPSNLRKFEAYSQSSATTPKLASAEIITQDHFYRTLSPFFRSGDVILAETGTAGYGSHDFQLPPQTHLFKPITWLSIGYMLPAALGAAIAQRERPPLGTSNEKATEYPPRTILLIGDGSFQVTVQELATIIREKLNVVIFLINNKGYTIERCLHGWDQRYNDIATFRYLQAPTFMGADEQGEYQAHTFTAKTWGDLERVMGEKVMTEGKGLRMIEVFTGWEDAPPFLAALLQQQKDAARDTRAR